ncbi:MAG TPA: 2'-5' RNA ligase family protein [Jatrophihabitans sp.]|nr:2'-5' RNA ligase family protein [Jatrophihabitans sp.]
MTEQPPPDGFTGLIVPFPELEPLVGEHRLKYDNAYRDVPAHISVLVPWLPPAELTEADLDAVGQLVAGWQPFEVGFTEFGRFDNGTGRPGVHYLRPDPAEQLLALTEDLATVWPEFPPYGGQFDEVVPHLTVCSSAGLAAAEQVRAAISAQLPVRTRVEELVAFEVRQQRYAVRRRFPLGGRRAGKGRR